MNLWPTLLNLHPYITVTPSSPPPKKKDLSLCHRLCWIPILIEVMSYALKICFDISLQCCIEHLISSIFRCLVLLLFSLLSSFSILVRLIFFSKFFMYIQLKIGVYNYTCQWKCLDGYIRLMHAKIIIYCIDKDLLVQTLWSLQLLQGKKLKINILITSSPFLYRLSPKSSY